MKKLLMMGLTAAVLSTSAMASEVTGYTASVTGQPATASGVNANFQALIDAINDNNARIASLESFSVSGRAYRYKEIGFIMSSEKIQGLENSAPSGGSSVPSGFARIGIFTATASLIFNSDNTVVATVEEREVENWVNSSSDIGFVTNATTPDIQGTWSQGGDNVVTVDLGGSTIQFNVSRGADTLSAIDLLNGGLLSGTCQTLDRNGDSVDESGCENEFETSFGVAVSQVSP